MTFHWRRLTTLALPVTLVLAAASLPAAAEAARIKDGAGLFSARAVGQAQDQLDRIESESRLPTTIETVNSLDGEPAREVLRRHARDSGAAGLYVLISKREARIEVEPQNKYRAALPSARTDAIRDAFVDAFKKKDFDAGLLQGVRTIGLEADLARSQLDAVARGTAAPAGRRGQPQANPPAGAPARRQGGGFGLGSLLTIGLLVVGGLFLFRLVGSLFGGNRGYGAGNPMMGGRGMGGPGMGGPGYGYGGGGGGGFMSSMFGGIGGALAGNWIYDQMTGRRHGGDHTDAGAYSSGASYDPGPTADHAANDWTSSGSSGGWGGDDGGGGGSSGGEWGGGSGGDWGGSSGGDWGGGGGGGDGGGW